MSTQKRFIPKEEAQKILKDGGVGVLSTISPDGTPYGVPVHYCFSQKENCVFFHCARKGRKIDNILFCAQVSFLVIGPYEVIPEKTTTRYESAVASGTAEIVDDPQEKAEKLRLICEKFAPGMPAVPDEAMLTDCRDSYIVKINLLSVSGKRNRCL